MKGWRAPQPEQRPKECVPYARPDAASTSKSETRRASSSSDRVALRVLRARDRTGAVRPFSGAIGDVQAPTSARAIRVQGPQTGALRAVGAHGRGTGFEALRAAAHRKSAEKMLSSLSDPRRTRTSHHPAMLGVSHPGRVRYMAQHRRIELTHNM